MSSDKVIELQHVIRENSAQLQNYLTDLEQWEKDMKRKDEEIKKRRIEDILKKPLINDVQKCDKTSAVSSSSNSCKKELALQLKDAGNKYLKDGNFSSAVEKYTEGIREDPENALLPANRALAYLKLKKFEFAETDCTSCLSLDPRYVKAFLRRGSARTALQKFKDAENDFHEVLKLEPNNQEAIKALADIKKELLTPEPTSTNAGSKDAVDIKEVPLNGPSWVPASRLKDSSPVSPIKKQLPSKEPVISIPVKLKSVDKPKSQILKPKEINAITSSSIMEPELPVVPLKSYQFESDWKKLKEFPALQCAYLKQFPSENFPVLFKNSMETELLAEIIKILNEEFIKGENDIASYLINLSQIGRFQTLLMLLSDEENEYKESLLKFVKASDSISKENKNKLAKIYGC